MEDTKKMTLGRLGAIKDRLTNARNSNPRGVLPQMGDLKAMEELISEVERLKKEIDELEDKIEQMGYDHLNFIEQLE